MNRVGALIVDLDSTVYDTRHRWHLAPIDPVTGAWDVPETERRAAWMKYSLACPADTVINPVRALIQSWHGLGGQIHIVSGRDICAEHATIARLDADRIPYHGVHLFRAGERGRWEDHKTQTIWRLRGRGVEPVLFVDDWPPIAEKITARTGVPVMLVTPPYGEKDTLWPTYGM